MHCSLPVEPRQTSIVAIWELQAYHRMMWLWLHAAAKRMQFVTPCIPVLDRRVLRRSDRDGPSHQVQAGTAGQRLRMRGHYHTLHPSMLMQFRGRTICPGALPWCAPWDGLACLGGAAALEHAGDGGWAHDDSPGLVKGVL
jgi:hypothetical protein